jgi:two-component sensor histidine kinase
MPVSQLIGGNRFSITMLGVAQSVYQKLAIDATISCGPIVNELIPNALKHAFLDGKRGRISIELASDPENQVVLSVNDDGIGIPDERDLANTTAVGLQLAALLAEQLGEMEIHRLAPPALCCNLGSNREAD